MTRFSPDYFFDLNDFQHNALFVECKFVWETLSKITPYLNSQRLGLIETDIPAGAYLVNQKSISIGKGSLIEPGAYIQGPCIIGERCVVRHGAYIRGSVITGSGCVLGHDSEFKNAILLNKAHAAHFAYVGDTILGNDVNLGAGVVCANLRLDGKSVVISVEDLKIDSGLRKFGAIVGDYSQIGCNSVTNPGTLLGKNVLWYPGVNYGGFVPAQKRVRQQAKICIHDRDDRSL